MKISGMEPAWDLHGKYSTDLFTSEAVKLIKAHNGSKPMFLYLAHAAVHSGNPYNPLPAPDETVAKFSHIRNYSRRRYAGELILIYTTTRMFYNHKIFFSYGFEIGRFCRRCS